MGSRTGDEQAADGLEPVLAAALRSLPDWQHADAAAGAQHRRQAFELRRYDPAERPFSTGDKSRDKSVTARLATEIDRLQNLFYADRRYKLLVILQGTDTSGKDGTVRGVFGQTSPLGVHTVGWKAPAGAERSHDYLWRIHQQVPGDGEIMVFNRSHYEDVLVPRVLGTIDQHQTRQRYAHINDFERMLTETGTVICKFLLHISKDEQRERLQARIDDPAKHWKFELGDLEARQHWDAYQQAYSDAIAATGTAWAPWTVVPADSKTHRNLMIACVIANTLRSLALRFPPAEAGYEKIRIE